MILSKAGQPAAKNLPAALCLLAALSSLPAQAAPRVDLIDLTSLDTARPDGEALPPVATTRIGSQEEEDAFLLVEGIVQARSSAELTPTEVGRAEDLAGFVDRYARLTKALGKETRISNDTTMPVGGNLFALRTRRTWTWERPEGKIELIVHRTDFEEKSARVMARAMLASLRREQGDKPSPQELAQQEAKALSLFRQECRAGTRLEVRAWNALSDSSFPRALSRCNAACQTDSLWGLDASEAGSFTFQSDAAPATWFAFRADSSDTRTESSDKLGKSIALTADRRIRKLPQGTLVLETIRPDPKLASVTLAAMHRQAVDQSFGLGPKSPEIVQVRKVVESTLAKVVPGYVRTLFQTRRLTVSYPAPTEPEADLGPVSE